MILAARRYLVMISGEGSDQRRTLPIQESVRFNGISVLTPSSVANSVEKPQCDERIEKIEPAARMDSKLLTKLFRRL